MSESPLFSIIIPHWNGKKYLKTCLDSLLQQNYPSIEIIIVDNASTDGSQAYIKQNYPQVILLELPVNRGFTGACNAGLATADGEFVALLNNDTEVDPGWALAVVNGFQKHPEAGSIASKMLLFDQRNHIHTAGDYFTIDGRAGNRGVWQQDQGDFDREAFVFSACGGSSAYRRSMIDEIGVLDDDFFFLLEDVDLGWRAQLAGWRCLYTPQAVVYHHLSATGGGVTASYYDGRNSLWLLIKNYPAELWRKHYRQILRRQAKIAFSAVRAWRGKEARAHLRGMLAGLIGAPAQFGKRRQIQHMRHVSIEVLEAQLSPPQD
ncbi:MAG: glycosyltransferase family 2 protein [Anaerolineae bacterium]|nr:glycosyltransferase family 2 protein [Anaerolineae bacterium]